MTKHDEELEDLETEVPPSEQEDDDTSDSDTDSAPEPDDNDAADAEYDASEEIAKEAADAAPQTEESTLVPAKSNPQLSRYQDFLNQYKALQDQRQRGNLVAGLAAAGAQIGQSMAGKYSGKFDPDQSGSKMLQQMANQPVQDFEQRQIVQGRGLQLQSEMAAADPKSPQSKLVRDYVQKRLGMVLGDDVSAADAQMLLKTVGRPVQTKYQKVNGTWTDPDTGESKRMSAVFNPATGSYQDSDTGKSLPGFLAEGLNPFQFIRDPDTGELTVANKSRGTAPSPVTTGKAPVGEATGPQEVNASLTPVTRKELNDKVVPAFNKETEKIQQRLNHVDVIMQRLQEAQTNPAALPQLKAEMARFDVGDQRLAQQELEMFAKRQGYKGLADWTQAHTEGTISPDFANDMGQAITHVSQSLKNQLSQAAEKHAKILSNRLPPGQKVDPKIIAPLIYGEYQPSKAQGKQVIKKGYNPTSDKTQLIYSDGTKEIVDGRQ